MNRSIDSIWPMGLGALTPRGMKQHYLLGKELRKKFRGFLNETYSAREIEVISTDYDRTLMSAQMNMAGLYGESASSTTLSNYSIPHVPQPVPIHPDHSGILHPGENCPAFRKEEDRVRTRSFHARQNREENGTLMRDIKYQSGNVTLTMLNIADAVFCSEQHGIPLPRWIADNKTIRDYLHFYYHDLSSRLYMDNDKLARLGGGPLLSAIVQKMHDKVGGKLTQKVLAYSAHDITVMALLSAMRVFDGKQPFYASLVSVDLYRSASVRPEDQPQYFVQVRYLRGSSKPDITKAEPLDIPGCARRCPLKKFIRLLRDSMPEDITASCLGSSETPEATLAKDSVVLTLSMVIALLVASLFFSCVYFLVRQRRMRNLLPTARFSLVDDGEIEASVPLTSHYDDENMYGYNSG